MTNVNSDIATVMKLLGNGAGKKASTPNLAALKGEQGAFNMEMMMANRLMSDPSQDDDYSAPNMDMGVMNNMLMLEALNALNSVKGLNQSNGLKRTHFPNYKQSQQSAQDRSVKKMSESGVTGNLSAKFESGSKGVSAIGYDRIGGTSYGKYQIASKTGTMNRFIEFLKDKAPQVAEKLLNAGPSNTGSKYGDMPDVWKQLASEDPNGFEKLQHDFIQDSHYDPAAKMILQMTGVDMNSMPEPLREVLWSTSVQHGPTGASRLISKAIDKLAANAEDKGFPSELVKEIYGERSGQFSSSSNSVQRSVANRLKQEQNMVLAMLGEGVSTTA